MTPLRAGRAPSHRPRNSRAPPPGRALLRGDGPPPPASARAAREPMASLQAARPSVDRSRVSTASLASASASSCRPSRKSTCARWARINDHPSPSGVGPVARPDGSLGPSRRAPPRSAAAAPARGRRCARRSACASGPPRRARGASRTTLGTSVRHRDACRRLAWVVARLFRRFATVALSGPSTCRPMSIGLELDGLRLPRRIQVSPARWPDRCGSRC